VTDRQRKCEICREEKSWHELNGYGECRPCGDKRVAKQRTESGLASDHGPEADAALDAACAKFPVQFELRAFRGGTFRVSREASYVSQGQIQVYTEALQDDGKWVDFAKGTVAELLAEIVQR